MSSSSRFSPRFTDLDYGITAIDTEYIRPLMDASHLLVHGGRAAFIDTGTAHCVPSLLEVLDLKGIDRADVDYVFLTHVHLDHAGGAGELMQYLPNAAAVIHPRGAHHMAEPDKLIAGTIAVYGEKTYRALYKEIVPIDANRIIVVEDGDELELSGRRFDFIHTRGHANHHYCVIDPEANGIFSGDSFGLSYRELDTPRGEFILPTTTPVHFDADAAHEAIDRLLGFKPQAIYLTHYSRVTELERLGRDMHESLDAFVALARTYAQSDERTENMQAAMRESLWRRLDEHGFPADEDRRQAILGKDIELNVMGLEVWLDRQADSSGRS